MSFFRPSPQSSSRRRDSNIIIVIVAMPLVTPSPETWRYELPVLRVSICLTCLPLVALAMGSDATAVVAIKKYQDSIDSVLKIPVIWIRRFIFYRFKHCTWSTAAAEVETAKLESSGAHHSYFVCRLTNLYSFWS